MDIEKLKSICEESSQPIGNMDEFPLVKALHKSSIFRSNVGPQHVLELIKEIQTLRDKVEVLVGALNSAQEFVDSVHVGEWSGSYSRNEINLIIQEALATYDKHSEVKHDTK
ncbi:MAG: hypothetical protein CTY32_08340 [Methylotenera sp.]|nr:MAG: hypothetical protein CTY32_08340 [Methylotenera sp.]